MNLEIRIAGRYAIPSCILGVALLLGCLGCDSQLAPEHSPDPGAIESSTSGLQLFESGSQGIGSNGGTYWPGSPSSDGNWYIPICFERQSPLSTDQRRRLITILKGIYESQSAIVISNLSGRLDSNGIPICPDTDDKREIRIFADYANPTLHYQLSTGAECLCQAPPNALNTVPPLYNCPASVTTSQCVGWGRGGGAPGQGGRDANFNSATIHAQLWAICRENLASERWPTPVPGLGYGSCEAILVHEFAHTLGISHEMDTGRIRLTTPADSQSVMADTLQPFSRLDGLGLEILFPRASMGGVVGTGCLTLASSTVCRTTSTVVRNDWIERGANPDAFNSMQYYLSSPSTFSSTYTLLEGDTRTVTHLYVGPRGVTRNWLITRSDETFASLLGSASPVF